MSEHVLFKHEHLIFVYPQVASSEKRMKEYEHVQANSWAYFLVWTCKKTCFFHGSTILPPLPAAVLKEVGAADPLTSGGVGGVLGPFAFNGSALKVKELA